MQDSSLHSNEPALKPNEAEPVLNTLAQYRTSVPVAFALVVIFFFFGFCSFKCNGTKVASLKGISLVTGTHLKTRVGGMLNNLDAFSGGRQQVPKGEKIPANFWAIIAFFSAIGGFVAFYRKEKREALIGTVLGVLGFLALLILRWIIKSKVDAQGGGMVSIEAGFLFGYWASLLAFIVAGGISYLRFRQQKTGNAFPEKNAGSAPKATPIQVNIITRDTDPPEDR